MTNGLPYAVEAQVSLSPQELMTLKALYESEFPNVKPQTKFNYAWGLVRSSSSQDQTNGVELLHEIYRENPSRRRECLYYLALGEFKRGHYLEAKKYNEKLLQSEPQNQQALSLQTLISERLQRDGLIGVGIVGAVVTVTALVAGLLFSKRK